MSSLYYHRSVSVVLSVLCKAKYVRAALTERLRLGTVAYAWLAATGAARAVCCDDSVTVA
jgi:hypothetical protein